MAIEIAPTYFTYPGIPDFETATYSPTHGITPGLVIATTRIPPDLAAPFGTCVLSDGARSIVLRDCKYQRRESSISGNGQLFTVHFLDRRWRWQFGSISGTYNKKDDRGNLVPWMARKPKQLAEYCLEKMGEKGYLIDLPDGIGADQLDQTNDNPAPGEMTPPTGSNPLVEWVDELPAVALARLCDTFGRRIIFDPVRDIVVIARPGDGEQLPANDFLDAVTDGIDAFAKPAGIGVVGEPVKYQVKLKLEPVGLEWWGGYVHIDKLSYRPKREPKPGHWKIVLSGGDPAPLTYTVSASIGGYLLGPQGFFASTDEAADWLANAISSNGALASRVTVGFGGSTVDVVGRYPGDAVPISVTISDGPPEANAAATVQTFVAPTKSAWDLSVPGSWDDVEATDRLSYNQARELAMKSVYRCFRITSDDVSNGWGGALEPKKIFVPFYGEVDRRQNLELLQEKVEQIVPEAPNPELRDVLTELPADQVDYYDGYSRSQSAVVYGSIANELIGRWHHRDSQENTPAGSRVSVPFVIDTANQMIVFTDGPVFINVKAGRSNFLRAPNLVLETGVHVLDNKTFAPVRYRRWIEFGPPAAGSENRDRSIEVDLTKYGIKDAKPFKVVLPRRRENVGSDDVPKEGIEWHGHGDDVRMGIIGRYQYDAAADKHVLLAGEPDEFEARNQETADNYLIGHMLEHVLEAGQTATYFGIQPIALDGAIMQVTWRVGAGIRNPTVASRNHTHGFAMLPYPAIRKNENLAADGERTKLNLLTVSLAKAAMSISDTYKAVAKWFK